MVLRNKDTFLRKTSVSFNCCSWLGVGTWRAGGAPEPGEEAADHSF